MANYGEVRAGQPVTATATVSNGTSLSGAVDLSGGQLARIVIPSAWTTANLTFQVSYDNSTFSNLYDSSGNEYTVTVTGASTAIVVPISDFIGIQYIKVRSGTSGSAVNQGADRAIILVLKPL